MLFNMQAVEILNKDNKQDIQLIVPENAKKYIRIH